MTWAAAVCSKYAPGGAKKKLNVAYTVRLPGFEADVQQIWEITKDGDLLQTIFGRGAEGRPDIRKNYYVPATVVQ